MVTTRFAMVYKARKILKLPKTFDARTAGVSLIELMLAVTIVGLIVAAIFIKVDPTNRKSAARDGKRLSDIALLDRVISEYYLDNEVYPDLQDTVRQSTSLPDGGLGLDNSQGGWILQNLSTYTSRLPLDPLNDETYYYTYIHDDFSYELNARLEVLSEYAQDDGGDDATLYEIGNNLQLISP